MSAAVLCQPRIAAPSSIKAVSFPSACTTKRFPSLRCASTIQIVRPQGSTAETDLQPFGFVEIVGDYFPVLHWPPRLIVKVGVSFLLASNRTWRYQIYDEHEHPKPTAGHD